MKILNLRTLGILAAVFFFTATPAWSGNLEERIAALEQEVARVKPLEDELARLKAEQAQARDEQMELQKEATAAVAALPRFIYRPGGGLMIEDANGAWGIRFFTQFMYYSTFWLDENRSGGDRSSPPKTPFQLLLG